jgi:sphingomyelin phosphodiesterase acid-like 3
MKHTKYFITLVTITLFALLAGFKNSRIDKRAISFALPVINKNIPDTSPCFLAVSDIHLDITNTHKKDTPTDLWNATKEKINQILSGKENFNRPKFVLVLGDLPAHDVSVDERKKDIDTVLSDLKKLADKNGIPIFYLPGNNDSWSGDYNAFSNQIFSSDSSLQTSLPLLKNNSVRSDVKIIDSSLWKNIGCYSAYPLGNNNVGKIAQRKLRLIALNSVVFVDAYSANESRKKQETDSRNEIQWLTGQLKSARIKNEFVLIAMHVPPGMNEYKGSQFWTAAKMYGNTTIQDTFLRLVEKYKNNIVGVLSGHTHMDGIRKLLNEKGSFENLLISVPGISRGHGNNPGMKIVYYNTKNFELNNFVTIYNSSTADLSKWSKYSFQELFNNSKSCSSMRSVIDTMNFDRLKTIDSKIYLVDPNSLKYQLIAPISDRSINVPYQ